MHGQKDNQNQRYSLGNHNYRYTECDWLRTRMGRRSDYA